MSYNTDLQENNTTLQSILEVAQTLPTHGVNYSTEETLTGGTWIDGKPIYRKVIPFGQINNGTIMSKPMNTGPLSSLVNLWGYGRRDTDLRPLPVVATDMPQMAGIAVSYFDTDPQVYVSAGTNGGLNESWFIVEYTKASD